MSGIMIQPAAHFFDLGPMDEFDAAVYKMCNQISDDLERQKRECPRNIYVVPVRDFTVQLEPVLQQVMREFRNQGYAVERGSFRGMSVGLKISKAP